MIIKYIFTGLFLALTLASCTSDNEHFCIRYQYVYSQLNDPELPGYLELKQQLQTEIAKKQGDNDHEKFMLFVLEDYHSEIKPATKEPKSFCMSAQRWKYYH